MHFARDIGPADALVANLRSVQSKILTKHKSPAPKTKIREQICRFAFFLNCLMSSSVF
jgi:hypothetical protein